MIGFPTAATAHDAAHSIAWNLADSQYDVFYPSAIRNRDGAGWLAQVSNGRDGNAFRALLFGPAEAERYLAALKAGEGVLVPRG